MRVGGRVGRKEIVVDGITSPRDVLRNLVVVVDGWEGVPESTKSAVRFLKEELERVKE